MNAHTANTCACCNVVDVMWIRYMSQVTCRFPQACRVGNPQMAARQGVNFRARSADRSCGIRGKRKIPRGSWHHLQVGCYLSLVIASYRSWDSKSWAKYRFCVYVRTSSSSAAMSRLRAEHVSNHLESGCKVSNTVSSFCAAYRTKEQNILCTWLRGTFCVYRSLLTSIA